MSGFTHIAELVTLDNVVCPDLIDELIVDDWYYNIHADGRITWFRDACRVWQVAHDAELCK